MTDEPMESGQGQGASELPKPKYQEPADEQTSAVAAPNVISNEILAIIREEAAKAAQSTKDKRFDKVERTFGDLSEIQQMLEAVKGGQEPKELLEALELKQIKDELAQIKASVSQPAPIPGKSEAEGAFAKAKGIIEAAGLNNNPRIFEVMGGTYANPSDMLEALNLTVLEEVTGKPRATDASKVTPSSGRSPQTAQQAEQTFNALLQSEDGNIDVNALIAAAEQIKD